MRIVIGLTILNLVYATTSSTEDLRMLRKKLLQELGPRPYTNTTNHLDSARNIYWLSAHEILCEYFQYDKPAMDSCLQSAVEAVQNSKSFIPDLKKTCQKIDSESLKSRCIQDASTFDREAGFSKNIEQLLKKSDRLQEFRLKAAPSETVK